MRLVFKGVFLKADKGYDTSDGKHIPDIVAYDGGSDSVVINGVDGSRLKPYEAIEIPVDVREGKYGFFVSRARD